MIYVFLSTYVIEWAAFPWISDSVSWYLLLLTAYLRVVLALQLAIMSPRGHRVNHALVFCAMAAYSDLLDFSLWWAFDFDISSFEIAAAVFASWSVWIYYRSYDTESDTINPANVMILLHRPTRWYSIAHSFIGLPFGSVCVMTGLNVWSFKRKTDRFEKQSFHTRLLSGHLIIDTGIPLTDEILECLDGLVGTPRGLGMRCVRTLKPVLEMLGNGLAPRGLFWFIPGVFAFKILKRRESLRNATKND